MTYTEKWAKQGEGNAILHMEVQAKHGIEYVEVEAGLFRVMLAQMGWMPLTEEPTPDRFVHITD